MFGVDSWLFEFIWIEKDVNKKNHFNASRKKRRFPMGKAVVSYRI